jgi:protein-disulfide isomerase
MFRPPIAYLAAGLLLVAAGSAQTGKKSAYNKAELESYVRHLWVIPPAMGVTVGDAKPSELTGFKEVRVKITQGTAAQEVLLYVSADGGKVLQGNVYDVNFNPFKKDLDKLQTAFQPSLGTPGATVVLVLFSDMQCPFCKAEAQMLRQNLVANYPTQVRLYFIDFPLESLHPWAKAAAIAGRCVFKQDPAAFWEYHDWMYGHQDSTTLQNLKEMVTVWSKDRKDLDTLQLGQCMDTKATEKEVEAEMAKGKTMDVEGTPTLFVNGRRIPNSVEWPNLKATIDNEIEYQKVAKNAGEDCGCELKLDVPGLPKPAASPIKKQ